MCSVLQCGAGLSGSCQDRPLLLVRPRGWSWKGGTGCKMELWVAEREPGCRGKRVFGGVADAVQKGTLPSLEGTLGLSQACSLAFGSALQECGTPLGWAQCSPGGSDPDLPTHGTTMALISLRECDEHVYHVNLACMRERRVHRRGS